MVLVDTSIWVDHFRQGSQRLQTLLMDSNVMCHPFVIGELACGNLANRREILALLSTLPATPVVEFDELMFFIDQHRLMGKGVGFVDIHLLASARLADIPLYTSDKRLKIEAERLGLAYQAIRGR